MRKCFSKTVPRWTWKGCIVRWSSTQIIISFCWIKWFFFYWDWIAWRYISITDIDVIMFDLNVWLPIVSTVPRGRTHIWTWASFRKPFIYVYPAGCYFVKNGPLYKFEVLYVLKVDAFLNRVVIYITCNIRLSMLYFVIVLIVMRAFLYSFRV